MKLRGRGCEHKFRREEMLANAPEVQSGCLVVRNGRIRRKYTNEAV